MAKQILYIDYLSPKGHVGFNNAQIQSLRKLDCNIHFVLREGYAESLGIENDCLTEIPNYFYRQGQVLSRLFYILGLKYIERKVGNRQWDFVIFSSYESISLLFGKVFKGAFILNHNNIRDLDNSFKKTVFKKLSKYYVEVVFNELCQKKLQDAGIENTCVIPHGFIPIPTTKETGILDNFKLSGQKYILFPGKGLSAGELTDKIISDESILNYCKSHNIKIVTRIGTASNPVIVKIEGYLDSDEYYTLLKKSFVTVLCYDQSFKYRVSGILFECMNLGIPAIIFQNESLSIYSKFTTIDEICFSTPLDFIQKLNEILLLGDNAYYRDLNEISDASEAWSKVLNIERI